MSGAAERWSAVEELFYRALEEDPVQREAFLDAACADDPELRREVASLLAARDDGGRLEARVQRAIQRVAEDVAAPGADRRIGRYRLLGEIGHGGMGVVYLAERADGAYEQRVAIKLVKGHVAGPEAHRRFLAERQILARLEHPAIARLLDGGATDDGTPYLVMEHVDGEPIDRWCRRRGLGVEARLRLFLAVCEAVDSAHRQLVVHRDIKPSNVLVGPDGRPKLLDFGVAKLLDEDEGGPSHTVEPRLTPGYASPEQVLGGPITTASDVYSLGVVLYELLAGRPPFPTASLTPAQLLDAVRSDVPPRPSLVAELPAAAGEPAGAASAASERQLRRRLRGDLDAIIMKALRKEPERRYPSVASLADDLHRHLAGLPVAAHAESWAYLGGKWLRRHAVATTAAALVVLALVGGLVARTLEARRANREAATAERVSDFLVSLLSEADPESSRGRDLTVLEAVDRGAEKLDRGELADDPLIQAHLLEVIGQVYTQRGVYEPAERRLRRALELRQSNGADPADVAESLEALGDLWLKQDRFEEAEKTLRRSLAIRRAARPPDPVGLANSQTLLGIVLVRTRHLGEAEALLRQAYALRVGVYGEENVDVAKSLNNLAWVLDVQGKEDEAIEAYRRVIALKRRVLPPDHPSLGASLQTLAAILAERGEHEEARALRQEALDLTRRVFGEHHPIYAQTLGEMASQLQDEGRFDEAEADYRQALAIYTEVYQGDHLDVAFTLNNLASLLEDRGDPTAAEPLFVRSLEMRRRLLGDEHPAVARAFYNLARVRTALGRPKEGEALYRQALAIWRKTGSAARGDVGKTERRLGELLLAAGRSGEARPLLAEAVEIFADRPPDDPERRAAEAAQAEAARAAR